MCSKARRIIPGRVGIRSVRSSPRTHARVRRQRGRCGRCGRRRGQQHAGAAAQAPQDAAAAPRAAAPQPAAQGTLYSFYILLVLW